MAISFNIRFEREGLTNVLLDFFETHNICLADLMGQNYENDANMKGSRV